MENIIFIDIFIFSVKYFPTNTFLSLYSSNSFCYSYYSFLVFLAKTKIGDIYHENFSIFVLALSSLFSLFSLCLLLPSFLPILFIRLSLSLISLRYLSLKFQDILNWPSLVFFPFFFLSFTTFFSLYTFHTFISLSHKLAIFVIKISANLNWPSPRYFPCFLSVFYYLLFSLYFSYVYLSLSHKLAILINKISGYIKLTLSRIFPIFLSVFYYLLFSL